MCLEKFAGNLYFSLPFIFQPPMQKTLIIIAAVISLAAAGLGFINRSNLQTERKAKEDAVAQCDAAKKSMSAELKAAKDKLAVVGTDSEKNARQR